MWRCIENILKYEGAYVEILEEIWGKYVEILRKSIEIFRKHREILEEILGKYVEIL